MIGIDVGSSIHYARAVDWRGYEYSKKAFKFNNTRQGFEELTVWMQAIKEEQKKTDYLVGLEPTGHYWFTLGDYLRMLKGIRVKSKKELEERIYKYFDEINADLVINRWKYKLDEITNTKDQEIHYETLQ